MATAAAMEGLWRVIESMSLTQRNKKWLADKLIATIPSKRTKASTLAKEAVARLSVKTGKVYSKEDQEILEGFYNAVHEWENGTALTIPDDVAMSQLRKELKEEGYELD